MDTTQTVVLGVHTFIAVMIIVLVLLQRGKGADAGAAFGAGASGTVFGARGSTSFFSRMTAILAVAFFASSLTLAYLSSQTSGMPDSLIEDAPAAEQAEAPVMDASPEDEMPALPSLDTEADQGPTDDNELPSLDAGSEEPADDPSE